MDENVIAINLSPLYQDFNEDVAHEHVFCWRRQDGEQFNYKQTTTFTGIKTMEMEKNQTGGPTKWSNIQDPIDLSDRSSLERILTIRDITKRLRDLDETREKNKKLLNDNSFTEIHFKLEDIEFSLGLNPTPKQPGNAVLMMTGTECGIFKETHKSIEEFECFRKLDAKTIDLIVTRARQRGNRIRAQEIDNDDCDNDSKTRMAEQLTFFMLTYDFEIARRLQRPFVNKSEDLDSLPIGIGIAFNPLINRKRGNHYRWLFFSCLFMSKHWCRKQFLEEIIATFKEVDESDKKWTHLDLIHLLYEHFASIIEN